MIFHCQSHIWQISGSRVIGQNVVGQSNYLKKEVMKFIFGMQMNIEVCYKLILSFWVYIAMHAQSAQNKFAYLCNISKKTWGMKLIFCLQINTKVFYNFIVSLWVCIARHVQRTQKSKSAISLQYLNEM